MGIAIVNDFEDPVISVEFCTLGFSDTIQLSMHLKIIGGIMNIASISSEQIAIENDSLQNPILLRITCVVHSQPYTENAVTIDNIMESVKRISKFV